MICFLLFKNLELGQKKIESKKCAGAGTVLST